MKRHIAVLFMALAGPALAQAPDAALLERGRHLVEVTAACGNCHTRPGGGANLAGGFVFDEAPFRAVSSNITPDRETGVGGYSDAELARAIREGVRPDGSVIGPPMPFGLYRGLSDQDLSAIVAYLRTVPPVRNQVERSVYRMPLPPAYGPPVANAPAPAETAVARGAYLANAVAHCTECHTPMTPAGQSDHGRLGAGGMEFRGPWGSVKASNITPTGIGAYSDAQIIRAVTEGVAADGTRLVGPMPFAAYAGMTAQERSDLVAYLRSLPPQP